MAKVLFLSIAVVALFVGGATLSSAAVVINEVHHDPHPDAPPANPNGDANGDGTRDSSEDEFVEIVNDSGVAVDISGWMINDAVATRHEFPPGTILAPGCGIIVFGGGAPTGDFGLMIVQTASKGFLGFNNAGDTVELVAPGNVVMDTFSYTGGSDQSWTLNPDLTGVIDLHTTASGDPDNIYSAGTKIDGSLFDGCRPVQNVEGTWGAVKSMYR